MKELIKQARQRRVRAKLHGTAQRPRLVVAISVRHVAAQLIDDDAAKTLAAVTTTGKNTPKLDTMTAKADWVGTQIAELAMKAKVKQVIFDRGARQYHGRVKTLAEAARKNGLQF